MPGWRISARVAARARLRGSSLCGRSPADGGGELHQHLLPLVRGQLGEGLGMGLLDLVGRRGPQEVAVALDGLLVGRAGLRRVRGGVLPVLRRRLVPRRHVVLVGPRAAAEEPVEQSHDGSPFPEPGAGACRPGPGGGTRVRPGRPASVLQVPGRLPHHTCLRHPWTPTIRTNPAPGDRRDGLPPLADRPGRAGCAGRRRGAVPRPSCRPSVGKGAQ